MLIITTTAYVIISIFIGYVGAYVANKYAYPGHLLAGMSESTQNIFEQIAVVDIIIGIPALMAALLYFGKKQKELIRAISVRFRDEKILRSQIIDKHSLLLDPSDIWFTIGEGRKVYLGISNQLELTLVLHSPNIAPGMLFISKHSEVARRDLLQLESSAHELEGDFGQHYRFYMAQDYGTEALALVTPDNMAKLIDVNYPLNVEFVDSIVIFRSVGLIKGTGNEIENFLEVAKTLIDEFKPELVVASGLRAPAYIKGRNLTRGTNKVMHMASSFVAWLRYKLDRAREGTNIYMMLLMIITLFVLGAPFLFGNWLAQILHG